MPPHEAVKQSWGSAWWHKVRHSLSALVMLVALSTIVHSTHPDFGLAHLLARSFSWAVHDISFQQWQRQVESPTSPSMPEPDIKVLEIPQSVTLALEGRGTKPVGPLSRLGGDRPLDRLEVAKLLMALARDLPEPERSGRRGKVLALDFDIAPLGEPAAAPTRCASPQEALQFADADPRTKREKDESTRMIEALDALRARFDTVIAIVMSRDTCRERQVRRWFLLEAGCTLKAVPAADLPGLERGELHIASPYLPRDDRRLVSRYLGARVHDAGTQTSLPEEFPSLGTLVRLAADREAGSSAGWQGTLVSQCAAAQRPESPLLLEEADPDAKPATGTAQASARSTHDGLQARYEPAYIDWSALRPDRFESSPLHDVQAVEEAGDPSRTSYRFPGNGVFDTTGTRIFILATEGGAASDKHQTAVWAKPLPGATIHAATASRSRMVDAGPIASLLVDVAAGLLFLACWAVLDLSLSGGAADGRIAAGREATATVVASRPFAQALRRRLPIILPMAGLGLALGLFGFLANLLAMSFGEFFGVLRLFPGPKLATAIVCVGVPLVVVVATARWAFGQRGPALEQMPWLDSLLRMLLPLGVAVLVGCLALAFSFISLMRHPPGYCYYYDVSLVLIGLLVHGYFEAAHLHGETDAGHREPAGHGNRPKTWTAATLARFRAGRVFVLSGPRAPGWGRWLDNLLRWLVWLTVPSVALIVLVLQRPWL